MKKVWNVWTLFDSDNGWGCGKETRLGSKEVSLGQRAKKACRTRIGDVLPLNAGRLFRRSMTDTKPANEDVRMERVLRLRAAIATGCYKISSADLAEKLMSHMLREVG